MEKTNCHTSVFFSYLSIHTHTHIDDIYLVRQNDEENKNYKKKTLKKYIN